MVPEDDEVVPLDEPPELPEEPPEEDDEEVSLLEHARTRPSVTTAEAMNGVRFITAA